MSSREEDIEILEKELEEEINDLEQKQPQLKEAQQERSKEEDIEKEAQENQFKEYNKDWKETKGVRYGLDNEEVLEDEWLEDG